MNASLKFLFFASCKRFSALDFSLNAPICILYNFPVDGGCGAPDSGL